MLTEACPEAYYPSLPVVWGNHTLAATFRCGEYLNKAACGGIDGSCVHVQQSLLQLHRAIYLFTGVRCTRLTLAITAHAYMPYLLTTRSSSRGRSSTLGVHSGVCEWQGVFVDVIALMHAHACMFSNGVLFERHLIYHHPHPHHTDGTTLIPMNDIVASSKNKNCPVIS